MSSPPPSAVAKEDTAGGVTIGGDNDDDDNNIVKEAARGLHVDASRRALEARDDLNLERVQKGKRGVCEGCE